MFVLFETESWWWSIEENSEGITIQRSKCRNEVERKYRKESRPNLTLMKVDAGKKSMKDLIKWLYKTNKINDKYNYLSSNCKHFGKCVFNFMALDKKM